MPNNKVTKLQRAVEKNAKDGFVPIVSDKNILGAFLPIINNVKVKDEMESFCGKHDLTVGPMAESMLTEQKWQVIKEKDMKGQGAVKWGVQNNLPAFIFKTAKMLPYTSQGLEYQANATVGSGIKFIYKYGVFSNGNVIEKSCDFHLAGILLRARIKELKRKISEQEYTATPAEPTGLNGEIISYRRKIEPYSIPDVMEDIDDRLGTDELELEEAIKEYAEWRAADREVREFERNNDLAKVWNEMAQDDIALDISYPLIALELGSKEKWANKEWKPKIKRLSYSPAVITRVEKKDAEGNINYVYMNEAWRYNGTQNVAATCIETPTLKWGGIHAELEELRDKKGQSMGSWFAIINKHLSTEMEYYTFPAWWSIYPSLTFSYAMTLMLDKSIARKNDISWRRIIYVEKGYLEDLYANSTDGDKPEGRKKIREELEMKVNDFLSNKENNGKTLMVDYAISTDGKTLIDSIRVETLPETNQKSTEDEIHAISSVLFYALGVDPRLVGAVPGKQTSSSGTQARELELLNQKKLETRKARIRKLMTDIAVYNNWCPEHIGVVIMEKTLSTLDASKTGIVETEN